MSHSKQDAQICCFDQLRPEEDNDHPLPVGFSSTAIMSGIQDPHQAETAFQSMGLELREHAMLRVPVNIVWNILQNHPGRLQCDCSINHKEGIPCSAVFVKLHLASLRERLA